MVKSQSSPHQSHQAHQSLAQKPLDKVYKLPLNYFSLKEIANQEVKTYVGFFPKPLLCEEARVYNR